MKNTGDGSNLYINAVNDFGSLYIVWAGYILKKQSGPYSETYKELDLLLTGAYPAIVREGNGKSQSAKRAAGIEKIKLENIRKKILKTYNFRIIISKMTKILTGIKIDKIWYGWVGLARRQDGKRILIKGWALPGSIVDLKIVKEKKDFIEAHITQIIKTDPNIVDGQIFCPHFFSQLDNQEIDAKDYELKTKVWCWGCKRQSLNYATQLKLKEDIVLEAFEKLNKKKSFAKDYGLKTKDWFEFLPILGSPQEKWYRNKIEFSFGKYITNKVESTKYQVQRHSTFDLGPSTLSDWSLGFHKQGEFSKIIDIENCGLISEQANTIFEHIKKLCFKSWLPVYDQKTHQWFFRHLVIREGTNTQQFLINLSVSDNNLKEKMNEKWDKLLEKLKKDKFLNKAIDTFVITYNNELGDTIKNSKSETKIFWWEWHIYEKLIFKWDSWNQSSAICNLQSAISFRISPFSFFQTNTLGAQQLFSEAIKLTGHIEGDILDLYCGTGSIGLSFLKQACIGHGTGGKGEKLLGIEINEEAITDARYNAKINGLEEKVNFLAAPAEKAFMTNPELKDKIPNLGLVIIDPPRDGLHKNTITLISQLKKEADFKLLYISCNPITMKRDIELFIENWFQLKIIQPVDMFPQTHHIETIGILQ